MTRKFIGEQENGSRHRLISDGDFVENEVEFFFEKGQDGCFGGFHAIKTVNVYGTDNGFEHLWNEARWSRSLGRIRQHPNYVLECLKGERRS